MCICATYTIETDYSNFVSPTFVCDVLFSKFSNELLSLTVAVLADVKKFDTTSLQRLIRWLAHAAFCCLVTIEM